MSKAKLSKLCGLIVNLAYKKHKEYHPEILQVKKITVAESSSIKSNCCIVRLMDPDGEEISSFDMDFPRLK